MAFNLSWTDFLALGLFGVCWLGYNLLFEQSPGANSLNRVMDRYRRVWLNQCVIRENRVVDTTIMATLQNGAAFFASTSLIAIGAAMTLFRSTDEFLTVMEAFPLGGAVSRQTWEIKVFGLTVIFIYAFFKFSWSYRIFNYAAILIGAIPVISPSEASEQELQQAQEAAERAARMNTVAGRHFNRGQRAFFFALAYLSWFISAYALILATMAVILVMYHRQFAAETREALGLSTPKADKKAP